ncbi:Uncharacterised protein [Mycobacteroides abscessus subsp. bolletii]|nr:Uncharacterised protein [Mycobacteroides abscessus subsp. bolletii]
MGRVRVMSSNRVDISLDAAKYARPPQARAVTRLPRPITWLIGMKLRLINGISALELRVSALSHGLATIFSVYVAPLGVPVLPEV